MLRLQVRLGDAAVLRRVRRPRGHSRRGPRYRADGGSGVGPNDVLQHVVAVAAEHVLARRGRGAARRLLQPRKVSQVILVCPSWCSIDDVFHPTLQSDRGGADAEAGCGPRLRRGAARPHAQHSRGGGAEARVLGGKLLGKWEPTMVGYCRCRHIGLVNTEFLVTALARSISAMTCTRCTKKIVFQ